MLINYDQQWTSARYFQVCEGLAPAVTILNLAMMSFEWWRVKRALYERVSWPGTHYTREQSVAWSEGGFTFEEFVAANSAKFDGGIYLGGSLTYPGESWPARYEMVPFGLLSRVQLRSSPQSLEDWERSAEQAWGVILDALPFPPVLPMDHIKYSEETVNAIFFLSSEC